MTNDTISLIIVAWAAVGVLVAGIRREIDGHWEGVFDALPMIILWPMFIAFLAVVAVGWCLLWTGRGPVRLLVWIDERRARKAQQAAELPRAEIARRS